MIGLTTRHAVCRIIFRLNHRGSGGGGGGVKALLQLANFTLGPNAKSKLQTEMLDGFLFAHDMAKGAPTEAKRCGTSI